MLPQWSLFHTDVFFNEISLLSLKIRRIALPVGKLPDKTDFNRLRNSVYVRFTTLHRPVREIFTVQLNRKRQQDSRSAKVTRISVFENKSLLKNKSSEMRRGAVARGLFSWTQALRVKNERQRKRFFKSKTEYKMTDLYDPDKKQRMQ